MNTVMLMPQLDSYILASQLNIFLIFIIGYLLFNYYILPVITIFLKIDTKLLISKYKDINNISSYLLQNKTLYNTSSLILIDLATIYAFFNQQQNKHSIILSFLETEHNVKNTNK